jgi:PDZ domain-containing protein
METSPTESKRRILTPARVAGGVVGLLLATLVVLFLVPSNDYLLLPDPAHPVGPLVRVQGGHAPRGPGGIYFVDVFERRASMLESIFPWLHSDATLVPASDIVPPGASDQAVQEADLREMTTSQRVAAAVALRQLGMHVIAKPDGVTVSVIILGSHAAGALQQADVITSVNGTPTLTVADLREALAGAKVGQAVTLGVERGPQKLTLHIKTVADPGDPTGRRAIVGFVPDQSAKITLPIHVSIDAGNVGGPSAGLAFALEVMEKLGRKVDRGYKVAATGQIELNGAVTPIGGVKQKIFDARDAKIDVFLVPAGDNARVAQKYAGGIRVIPVKSFQQALHALATLPPKE